MTDTEVAMHRRQILKSFAGFALCPRTSFAEGATNRRFVLCSL